jgi:alpha-mannosidase
MQRVSGNTEKPSLSKLLNKSYKQYLKNIEDARAILQVALNKENDTPLSINAIGHSHLDVAWLWQVKETIKKAGRTFATQLNNIENYPEYIFGASQPIEYLFLKENYPALYERVKQAVASGRIEPLGGMWLEPDCNLSGGESLIRQIYYGKRFFKEEFDIEPNICWVPDVFGFGGTLPQILKKTGLDYFMTIKLSWNEVNKFPYTSFLWQGIDSSSVLVHMPPEGNYGSDIAPYSIKKALRQNKDDKSVVKSFLMPFGSSDGGGGAHQVHLEMLKRESNVRSYPVIKQQSVAAFFGELNALKDKLPKYKGELYLEKHQATFTSQANQKKYNRRSEKLLHNMEVLGALALKKGIPYDFGKAEEFWKSAMLEQFHDILPGSSITEVHQESVERYKKFLPKVKNYIDQMQNSLKKDNNKLSAINLSPARQKSYIHTEDGWVYADIKPYSAKVVNVKELQNADLACKPDSMENDLLKVKFDFDGSIISLVNKITNKEFCKGGLNKLTIYKDKKRFWNAWDFDNDYYKKKTHNLKLISHASYIDGANAIRKNVFSYGKSKLVQKVILALNCPYVLFETTVHWKETHKMLRADFYPTEYGDKAICDIQMGNIARSTKNETSLEKGQLEICAHKFLDVSNENFGTAILTHSKYGYRVKDGKISLNLLRSTTFPDKFADRGTHKFSYAYYPHQGSTFESEVVSLAYAFNNPIMLIKGEVVFKSLAKCPETNIIVETIKPAENGGYLLRVYENEGKDTTTEIVADFPYLYVSECDMLENPIETAKLDDLHFTPYEIKTLLLK